MLDLIRSNTQSFGVKLAFGIIILVFVFWGIGSITDTGSINVVAMVNGQPLTFQQFELAYRNAEEAANRQTPGRKWSDVDRQQLGRQVFQNLVSEELIGQEAARNNFSVSPYELRVYVDGIPAFQGANGKFDPQVYKRVLAQQRQTAAQFEEGLRRQLLHDKMVRFLIGGYWVDSMEPRNRFNYLRQRRIVEYLYLSAKDEKISSKPSAEECTAYYDAHKAYFSVEKKSDIEYVAVDPLKLIKAESLSTEEVEKWYKTHSSQFIEPKKANVSHILVPLAQDAQPDAVSAAQAIMNEIQKKLAEGKSFAELADKQNGPQAAGKGGDLGWIEPGATVPEFEKAVFSAAKGQIVGPVRTQFGLHLIQVNDIKEGRQKSFSEVESDIRKNIASEKGKAEVSNVLDALIEDNILGKPLEKSAEQHGLKSEKTGLLTQQEMAERLGLKTDAIDTIMSTPAGHPVDTPIEAGDRYLVVRVLTVNPASYKSFSDVRDEVEHLITNEKAVDAARSRLEAVLKTAGNGELASEWKKQIKVSSPMERGGRLDEFAAQPKMSDAVFNADEGKWLPTIFAVSDKDEKGVVAVRVKEITEPEDKEWKQFEGIMTNLMQRERVDGLYQAFMQDLVSRSKIKVMNQNAIDRKNM